MGACRGDGVMAQRVKCLLGKHENLIAALQAPTKPGCGGARLTIPQHRGGEAGRSQGLPAVSQSKGNASSRFRKRDGGGGDEVELPLEHPGLKYKVEKSLRKIPCQPCQVSTSGLHR